MSIVHSFQLGKGFEKDDLYRCFEGNAPVHIKTGAGPFRVFINTLKLEEGGYHFTGRVSMDYIQGVYDPKTKVGIAIFIKEGVAVRYRK
jgi:hypothetical protein